MLSYCFRSPLAILLMLCLTLGAAANDGLSAHNLPWKTGTPLGFNPRARVGRDCGWLIPLQPLALPGGFREPISFRPPCPVFPPGPSRQVLV